uniref:(northern house mosquito) hypothetical protein n=1 Tax=Culex pipiens TaxID=7175 RepID=A0A8D8F1W5_CULPI
MDRGGGVGISMVTVGGAGWGEVGGGPGARFFRIDLMGFGDGLGSTICGAVVIRTSGTSSGFRGSKMSSIDRFRLMGKASPMGSGLGDSWPSAGFRGRALTFWNISLNDSASSSNAGSLGFVGRSSSGDLDAAAKPLTFCRISLKNSGCFCFHNSSGTASGLFGSGGGDLVVLLTFPNEPSESPSTSTLRSLYISVSEFLLTIVVDLAAGLRLSGTEPSLSTSTERVTSSVTGSSDAAVAMFGVDLVLIRLFRTGGLGGE